MRKIPILIGVHAAPSTVFKWIFGLIPFVMVLFLYNQFSMIRHLDNPDDKLVPLFSQIGDATYRLVTVPDKRISDFEWYSKILDRAQAKLEKHRIHSELNYFKSALVLDTISTLKRLIYGLSLAAFLGLLVGLNLGIFRGLRAILLPFISFLAIIPPLAILPILLVVFGVDEESKIVLVFIGLFPVIAIDIFLTVRNMPPEVMTKALTLGASQLGIVYRVFLPQIMPRLLENIILAVGPALVYVIASEAIAATSGLGYQIYLSTRYMAMSKIIPLVLWITLLGYLLTIGLKFLQSRRYAWSLAEKE